MLIAGGIGITPIKAMAQALRRRNVPFELHYTGRTPADMAFREQLTVECVRGYFTYFSRLPGHRRLDVANVLRRAADDAVFYVCGPLALIEAVRVCANRFGIAPERVQHESVLLNDEEKSMIQLHEVALSGNCHKVRMLLSILGLRYESLAVDLAAGAHHTADYLRLNPFGEVPTLVDGEVVVRDSQAILVYLANRYGGERWWPRDPVRLSGIAAWLSTAANEIATGPNRLRLHRKWGRAIDVSQAEAITTRTLNVVDRTLANKCWLVGGEASIADLAVYPYLALLPEGGIDLTPYSHILCWFGEIRRLEGYVAMPGMVE